MAKCGHIFCLPCLIRYMHSTDDATPMPEKKARWKKCPICWDSIFMSEARPVRWFVGQEGEPPREGSDVVLRLMKRDADSPLALPRECSELSNLKIELPWYFAAEVMDYARVMKGSEDYMRSQFDEEINHLKVQEREDELMFGEETQWTRKAIAAIINAQERLEGIGNPPLKVSVKSEQKRPVRDPITFTEENDLPDFYRISQATKSGRTISQRSTEKDAPAFPSSPNEDRNTRGTPTSPVSFREESLLRRPVRSATVSSTPATTTFFFYQALLHYYLAPLDVRILKTAFDDYSLFPSAVLPRVERVSTGHIVDDDLRKRSKYLAHLPRGCEVAFLECDWTDIVPPSIIQSFSTELERRRKRNKDKEAREEKERLRAEKEEDDKKWAAIRRRRPSIQPELDNNGEAGPANLVEESLPIDLTAAASPPWSRKRTGFASLASPSTSPSGPKTVWGTAAVPTSESPPLQATFAPEAQESDGWLQGWEQDLLREEEHLISQVQTASLREQAPAPTSSKKKKNKKITLMSTNGRRAAQ
ncbi:MAG: hypothetical protein LQ340_003244 [Diploschistes diacapsis]|nr:MAG: hypothetical protein LQ340_003244 [Diploschistes diacapsis]